MKRSCFVFFVLFWGNTASRANRTDAYLSLPFPKRSVKSHWSAGISHQSTELSWSCKSHSYTLYLVDEALNRLLLSLMSPNSIHPSESTGSDEAEHSFCSDHALHTMRETNKGGKAARSGFPEHSQLTNVSAGWRPSVWCLLIILCLIIIYYSTIKIICWTSPFFCPAQNLSSFKRTGQRCSLFTKILTFFIIFLFLILIRRDQWSLYPSCH